MRHFPARTGPGGHLRAKDLHGPMLGAQRRIEARIGELLGEAKPGQSNPHHDEVSHDQTRADFRILAHALNGLPLTRGRENFFSAPTALHPVSRRRAQANGTARSV